MDPGRKLARRWTRGERGKEPGERETERERQRNTVCPTIEWEKVDKATGKWDSVVEGGAAGVMTGRGWPRWEIQPGQGKKRIIFEVDAGGEL